MPFNLMKEVPQIMCVLDYIATITKTIFLCLIEINPTYWLSLVYVLYCDICYGLPWWLRGRRSAYECRRHRRHGFDPLVWEDPLEEEMATLSSLLAGKIPWTEEPGGVQSPWGCKESDMIEHAYTHTHTCYLL